MMDRLGNDFNDKGSVMDKRELEELRRKRGECVTCGQKCFERKVFRMIPITMHGKVLKGRCLDCNPLEEHQSGSVMPAVSRVATTEELKKFNQVQNSLRQSSSGASVATSTSSRSREKRTPRRKVSNRSIQRTQSERGGSMNQNGSEARRASVSTACNRSHSLDSTDDIINEMSAVSTHSRQEIHPDSEGVDTSLRSYNTIDQSEHSQVSHYPGHRQASLLSHASLESGTTSGSSMAAEAAHTGGYNELDDTLHSHEEMPTNGARGGPLQRSDSIVEEEPNSAQMEEAFHRITGQDINNVEAISTLEGSDMAAHPTAAALLDYYRKAFRESQKSLSTNNSSGNSESQASSAAANAQHHGVLNRGGVVSFPLADRRPSAQGGLSASNHRTSFEGRRASSRYMTNSSRSLDSISSFSDEITRYVVDADHVEGNMSDLGASVSVGHSSGMILATDVSIASSRRPSVGRSVSSQSRTSNRSISSHDVGLERLNGTDDQDFVEILNVMRDYPDSMGVQVTGMQMLSEVKMREDDFETLLNLGAVHVIVEAMDSDPGSAILQISACRALLNGCGTLENQRAFCEAGIVGPVLRCMDTFRSNQDVQEQAISVLANLGASEDNLALLLQSGVVGRLIEAMDNHSENRHIQMRGCSAITNFASHTSPLKKNLMDQGGGGAVVVSMSLNQNDSELQERALRAIRNLSANSDDNKVELAHIGGIDSVVTAMQIHRDVAGVQEAGAWSLSNLAGHFENKRIIGDCGGIDVVIRAMWVHAEVASVQEWCIRALFTLTLDEDCREKVLEVGGLSAIVTAMQSHVESPAVQEMGCAVLSNLASNQERRLRIVDEEALDAIVLAMVVFSEELMVQQQACQVLVQLTITENLTALQASNVPSLVEAAGQRFEECRESANWMLNTLDDLAKQYDEFG